MYRIGIECESIEGKNPLWGVGKIITKLLEEISLRPELEKDFRFILYFKDQIPDLPFLNSPIFIKKGVPVPFFRGRLFPIYYFAFLPLKLWFEKLDFMFWPNYMLPIISSGKSIVMLTEDVYYEAHNGKLPFRYRLAYLIFCWWAAKHSTKIMAISETSKKNIAKLYAINPDRIFVNHLGVDLKKTINYKLETGNYLLYVGQMFSRRHAKETILAFEKIAPDFPDLKLIAIGPDKYETPTINKLVDRVNGELRCEAVIHKDYVSDEELNNLYANAKALIYVSDREAFGLPPMEAAVYGVPAIIADNDLGHELFNNAAFFVKDPNNINDIASAMLEALNNEEKRKYCKNNIKEIISRFDWKNFTKKLLAEICLK